MNRPYVAPRPELTQADYDSLAARANGGQSNG